MIRDIYWVNPVAKPRMTQSDKWNKRPAVVKYREFCDKVRDLKIHLSVEADHVIFHVQMAESWTDKKKAKMDGKPHQNKKDHDNMLKALMDAISKEDKDYWDTRITKVWSYTGAIEIRRDVNKFVYMAID